MKYFLYVIIATCLLFFPSCVEELDINIDDRSELIVIDAVVTDIDSVQTVYIRRERETLDYHSRYPSIKDVTVHIEDDNGWSGNFVDNGTGRKFTLEGHKFEPGRTYTIIIHVADREFRATETMVPMPDVDDLKFYSKDTKDDGCSYEPMLFFKDNQQDIDNYYLFVSQFEGNRYFSSSRYVGLQRLSDVGFRDDLDGIALSVGMGAESQFTHDLKLGSVYYYSFLTISRSNYDYFGVMEDQINNDGGIYKPTPTSPVTNFSGENVQGQFIAASRLNYYGEVTTYDIIDR